MRFLLVSLILSLFFVTGAVRAQDDSGKKKEEGEASFDALDLTESVEETEATAGEKKDQAVPAKDAQEDEPPLLDLSGESETPTGEPPPEGQPEEKPKVVTNILVAFKLTSDESAAEVIDLVNAEVHMVLDGSGKYQVMRSEDLAEGREVPPDIALGYCDEDPECIGNIVSEKNAHWVMFGNLKKSFDGTLIIARMVLLDVIERKVVTEEFGQFKKSDENLVPECGNLVRKMIGLEVIKPKPKPKPVVAKVEKPPELNPQPKVKKQASGPQSPWSNPWTWTLAGVGVASLAGGVALGLMSNNKVDDAKHPGFDQPAAYGIIQDAEDLALGANIAFGLGGAALAGAVVLFILDSTAEPAAAPAVACSGAGCTAVIYGRF